MDNKLSKQDEGQNSLNKIEWIGIDGLLVLSFFALITIMFCALKFRIDFLVGLVFPCTLLIIVLGVTVSYAMTLGGFIRQQNKKIRDNNQKEE